MTREWDEGAQAVAVILERRIDRIVKNQPIPNFSLQFPRKLKMIPALCDMDGIAYDTFIYMIG